METEKLELKHVVGYLPYGLKWSLQELTTFEMKGITQTTLYTNEGAVLNWEKHPDLPQALFPIMRPLSDLAKEIEINGQKFIPKEWLSYNYIGENLGTNLSTWSHRTIVKLYEWHFDIHGIIKNGLAIDINTL